MGIPVLHLLVLAAVHRIDLAVVVDLAQAPANAVVTWHYQYMIQQISFRFCVCCITSIQIGGDCVSSFYQFSILLVGSNQICVSLIWFSNFIDVGVVSRIVSVVVAIAFLAQIVLRVTVVSAPAVQYEGVQMWYNNLVVAAGNVGADVQLDIVVAQAIRECLCQYVCAIQSGLAGCRNVKISYNWELYAQCGQLLNRLLFVLLCKVGIDTCRGYAIRVLQACLLYTSPSPRDCS